MPRAFKQTLTTAMFLSLPRPPGQQVPSDSKEAEVKLFASLDSESRVYLPELAKVVSTGESSGSPEIMKREQPWNNSAHQLPFNINNDQALQNGPTNRRRPSFETKHSENASTANGRQKRISRQQYLISRLMGIEAEAGNSLKVRMGLQPI